MAELVTLDASILVAACRPSERANSEALELLIAVQNRCLPLIEPTLLIIEVAAALARTGTGAEAARKLAHGITQLPRLTLVNLDTRMAAYTAELAARHHLRGADATYAAVALMYGTVLVTLDKEQLKRHPEKLRVLNPAAALARLRA